MSAVVSQSSPPNMRPVVHSLPEHRTYSERLSRMQTGAATSTPPTTVRTPPTNSTPPQQQQSSKSSDFSISNLLAKDSHSSKTSSQPPQVLTPMLNPTALLLYHQWLATLARATIAPQASLFHGTSADVDNAASMQRPAANDDSDASHSDHSSIVSGRLPNVSRLPSNPKPPSQSPMPARYSPSTSPIQANGAEEREVTATPSNQSSDSGSGSVDEGRQNALLRVSEAHLAILPDEDGDTPLHLAIIQENVPLTMYLVRLVVGVQMNLDITNNLRQSPLHLAVITKQPVLVHLLIQGGAQVNFPDRRGNTCVHLAAQRKCVNILQILAQSTNPLPDYNCRNFAGLTPVHVATKEGSIDVLKFLFQMGANKNAADSCSGRTALHYAVEAENFQMCNFLLENGCNVNAAMFSGNTPLHIAAGRRLKEIVALLMAYGANPAIANGEGDFPSDLPASLLVRRQSLYSL